MNLNKSTHILFFLCVIPLLTINIQPVGLSQISSQTSEQQPSRLTGQVLFAPMNSFTTYLIDYSGTINHTWQSSSFPGCGVYWYGDGSILRTMHLANWGGGSGGGVQRISWDGTIIWDYRYYTSSVLSHHDIEPLPNGNVLMIAWETKTKNEAIAAGRNPSQVGNTLRPDHVIEVQPTGPTTGEIVWEWHVWDHLIQDYDPTKANYGVVSDHPELIDINFGGSASDWLHCNSIDYNADFDQIIISCHNFNEIWVIDHSTTTQEASGHTGGNSGKGGDLLYRWGNPRAYKRGTTTDQKLFDQHDTGWIQNGRPGEGNILIFNNGASRPGSRYSSIDELEPPVDGNGNYYLAPGAAYGPTSLFWSYVANPPTSFYANYLSGCERLADGNTLICHGPAGRFFEVTSDKVTVWQYFNYFPSPSLNNVFKIQHISPLPPPEPKIPDLDCDGSFTWNEVKPDTLLTGNFYVKNIGDSDSLLNWSIESYPNWGIWTFDPDYGIELTPDAGQVPVHITVRIPNQENSEFEGYIRVVNQDNPDDFDVIPIYLSTPSNSNAHWFCDIFLKNHHFLLYLLQFFQQIKG